MAKNVKKQGTSSADPAVQTSEKSAEMTTKESSGSKKSALQKTPKKSESAASEKSQKKKQPNKVKKYFRDLRSEVKKVVWPSRQEVLKNTSIVLLTMVVVAIFVWGVDNIFRFLLSLLLGASGS